MKYLCLVYLDEKRLDELPDEDCVEYDTAIRKSGHCLASEALQSVQTATTVRMRNGKLSVTDGPFAETKEQLAGFYMIEARDLNEAIQVAAKIPPARVGCVEVRPIRPIRETVAAKGEASDPGLTRETTMALAKRKAAHKKRAAAPREQGAADRAAHRDAQRRVHP